MSTFAVVENPGTDQERVVESGLKFGSASRFLMNRYTEKEVADGFAQVMKEGPEGLTTEF